MPKITTSLSRRVDARGKAEILLRFVGGRDHIYRLHSRLSVPPARWKEGAVVIPRLGTPEQRELLALRDRLDALVRHLLDQFQAADRARVNGAWMQEAVDRFHHPEQGAARGFFDLYGDFCAAQDVSLDRRKRYKVVAGALRRFEAVRGEPLEVEQVDAGTLDAFRSFLATEHTIARRREWAGLYAGMEAKPEERGKNIIIDYMKVVRAFYHWMQGRGLCSADPFRGYQIGTAVYGTPYFLSLEELDRLARTTLRRHPALAAQRDIFVFQCLVGCRVGDLLKLRKGDIVDGVLTYIPRKTVDERPVVVRVPLNDTAAEIVARYAAFPGDALLPFISKQKYNDAIKRAFLASRLRRPVAVLDPVTREEVKRPLNEVASSHLARRTFIGNLYKQVADPNLIGAMSGHTEGSRAFARYRTIDDEMKAGLVGMLDTRKKGEKPLPQR